MPLVGEGEEENATGRGMGKRRMPLVGEEENATGRGGGEWST